MDCFARHTVFLESRCDFGPFLHADCLVGGHVEVHGSVFNHVLKNALTVAALLLSHFEKCN